MAERLFYPSRLINCSIFLFLLFGGIPFQCPLQLLERARLVALLRKGHAEVRVEREPGMLVSQVAKDVDGVRYPCSR